MYRNGWKYTWKKPHVYRMIILKQMADHIHDALRETFLKVTISKIKLLNGTETSFRRGVRQTQTADLQTADLQTYRHVRNSRGEGGN